MLVLLLEQQGAKVLQSLQGLLILAPEQQFRKAVQVETLIEVQAEVLLSKDQVTEVVILEQIAHHLIVVLVQDPAIEVLAQDPGLQEAQDIDLQAVLQVQEVLARLVVHQEVAPQDLLEAVAHQDQDLQAPAQEAEVVEDKIKIQKIDLFEVGNALTIS